MLEIVYRKLSDLKPNPKNPRNPNPEETTNLAESIKKNGMFFEARPILVSDRTGELVIIAGERRSEAARLLGYEQVPTILLTGLTEEQEDEIMVRDNTHSGEWSPKKLAAIAAQWGGDIVKSWGTGVTWDAEEFVKTTIPELAGLGEEKELAEILNEEGSLARERIIITFASEDKQKIAEFLHLDTVKKVLYRFEEICES